MPRQGHGRRRTRTRSDDDHHEEDQPSPKRQSKENDIEGQNEATLVVCTFDGLVEPNTILDLPEGSVTFKNLLDKQPTAALGGMKFSGKYINGRRKALIFEESLDDEGNPTCHFVGASEDHMHFKRDFTND
eukprot:Clim_evm6s219 gene=Clim_evmTU6s219